MKWFFAFALSYLAVTFYFTVINFSQFAWFPFVLIVLIVLYFVAPRAVALTAALAAGILTDLHFLYMGPMAVSYPLILLTLALMQRFFIRSDEFIAKIALIIVACAEFFLIQGAWGGSIHGWGRAISGSAPLISMMLFIAVSSVAASLSHGIVVNIMKVFGYER